MTGRDSAQRFARPISEIGAIVTFRFVGRRNFLCTLLWTSAGFGPRPVHNFRAALAWTLQKGAGM
jgi:hypothetical protein